MTMSGPYSPFGDLFAHHARATAMANTNAPIDHIIRSSNLFGSAWQFVTSEPQSPKVRANAHNPKNMTAATAITTHPQPAIRLRPARLSCASTKLIRHRVPSEEAEPTAAVGQGVHRIGRQSPARLVVESYLARSARKVMSYIDDNVQHHVGERSDPARG